jgi:phosphate transport system protein
MTLTMNLALSAVQKSVLTLASKVAGALGNAAIALRDRDAARADEIIDGDFEVNRLSVAAEDRCAEAIATRQPVADDLRYLMAAVKIASNLERIGDHAVHVARVAKRLSGAPYPRPVDDLIAMARTGVGMVEDSVRAFVERDAAKAREVAGRDDGIDTAFSRLSEELIRETVEEGARVELNYSLLIVAKSLERVGDHVCNICEGIVYYAEGEQVELND